MRDLKISQKFDQVYEEKAERSHAENTLARQQS